MRLLDQRDSEIFCRHKRLQGRDLGIVNGGDAGLGGITERDPLVAGGIEHLAYRADRPGCGVVAQEHAQAGDRIVGDDAVFGDRHREQP